MSGRIYDQLAAAISLILLGLLAGLTFYLADLASRDLVRSGPRKVTHEPDYFVERFALTRLDAQGQPAFKMSALRLVHFPDDDSTEYVKPTLVSLDSRKPQVTLNADRGRSTSEGIETHLYDNVVLTRAAVGDNPLLRATTEYVLLLSEDDIARTDRPVKITNGPSTLTGVGMEFNNSTRQFEVLSQVKGTWVAPERGSATTRKP